MSTRIGFIGTGAMGEPMAVCLLRAGFPVTSYTHRNPEPLTRLVAQGATAVQTAAEVAGNCEVLITCVPDAPQVEEAIFAEHGLLAGCPAPRLFIDMSTISPITTKSIAQRLQRAGHRFLDAPVSGGPARAAEGTLTIMAGATDRDYVEAQPILQAMGTPTHVGAVGMGETVKLVNQIIISNVMIANAEALMFARKAGADIDIVRKVIATATGSNYILEKWLPKTWFASTFEGGFALDLLRKDLNAALEAAREMKMPMPASAFAYQLYTAQSAEGDGRRDYSAVARFYERIAGSETSRDV